MKLVLCRLPKNELPRYLSCYLKSDSNGLNVRARRRRKNLLLVSAVEGNYNSGGVQLEEVAIDSQVARVHLERLTERDILQKQAMLLLNTPKKRGRKPKSSPDDPHLPTLRELCERIVQSQTEPPVKRKRGRPRIYQPIFEPKSLRLLCERALNIQSPRRRGRKRKRALLQSPPPLKDLCKVAVESNKFRRRRGKRRKVFNPPSLRELCKKALGEEESDEEKETVVRSQRRRKFNKKWLGFADVPSVMKASYRGRLRRKIRGDLDGDFKPNDRVQKPETLVVRRTLTRRAKNTARSSDEEETRLRFPPIKTYKRKSKQNGILVGEKEENFETVYRLRVPEDAVDKKSQITIKFTDLLREIQKVTLPSSQWKIKIILYNQQISQIVFSNKSTPERCVNVYRSSRYYDISFDKAFVVLLGAPNCVDSLEDLNTLLQIVHGVKDDDLLLNYLQK